MATSVHCALREESFSVATHVRWPIISLALIHLCVESRAETGPVRCALGQTMNGLGAVG